MITERRIYRGDNASICAAARTVVDEERGHESAGGERDVEADEHVGEARRKDGLAEVLRPAVPDGRPGLVSCH